MIKNIKIVDTVFIISTCSILILVLKELYNVLNDFIYDMTQQVTPNIIDCVYEIGFVVIVAMFFLSILIEFICMKYTKES